MGLLPPGVTRVRRTVPWDTYALESFSRDKLTKLYAWWTSETRLCAEFHKHTPGQDEEFWSRCATMGDAFLEMGSVLAHWELKRLMNDQTNSTSCLEDWVVGCGSDKYQIRYLAHRQIGDIASRHAESGNVPSDDSGDLISLFMQERHGIRPFMSDFGHEIRPEHGIMFRRMLATYFPSRSRQRRGIVWDPVLGGEMDSLNSPTFYLYPWRQANSAKKIFSPVPLVDVFSPENGLFLNETIQTGLEHGIIAIIPDVGVDRSYTDFKERLETWWRSLVKEYQVVVVDPEHPAAFISIRHLQQGQGAHRLLDLDEHKLRFNSDFRPDVRYMWWAFLSAVTVASWRRKGHSTEVGRINSAIRNAIRYWGTPKGLVDDKVVSSFMATIAESTENLLDDDQQVMMRHDRDDLGVAVVAFERVAGLKDEREDWDVET